MPIIYFIIYFLINSKPLNLEMTVSKLMPLTMKPCGKWYPAGKYRDRLTLKHLNLSATINILAFGLTIRLQQWVGSKAHSIGI